jgi:nitroreductase
MTSTSNKLSGVAISDFLASRRSTRAFLPDPVPQDLLDQILTDALTAPSWSNTRPFKIAVASGARRDRISAEFGSRWASISHNLSRGWRGKVAIALTRRGLPTSNRLVAKKYHSDLKPASMRLGAELFGTLGIARDDRKARDAWWATNYDFYGAPTELFIYVHKSLGIFAASDAGLMMENLALSAHAHGLGTCMQGAVSIWDDVVRGEFTISKNYRLLCGLAIGYPREAKDNTFKAHRIAPEEMLFEPKSS